jgi:hypothetical protein
VLVHPDNLKRLTELRTELSLALGEAIWAFSMIEGVTYDFLKRLEYERPPGSKGHLTFKVRVENIVKRTKLIEGQDAEKAIALWYWDKALILADRRNEIAHNPWGIWISFETQEFRTEITSHEARGEKIDLNALRRFRDEAREVAGSLDHVLETLIFPATAGDSEGAV